MKKKSFVPAGLKDFVTKQMTDARDALSLSEWTIDVCYHKIEKKSNRDEKKSGIAGEISVSRRYLGATVNLYPPVFRMWNDGAKDEVRETIFHEVSHIWTEHMKDLVLSSFKDEGEFHDAWESLTSRIASIAIGYTSRKKK